MRWRIEFAKDALRDLELIHDYLADRYRGFGEPPHEALDHAARRVRAIVAAADRLAAAPHRGTIHDEFAPRMRHVTLGRAVYYFQIEPEAARVRVLAIFFGGQDHERRMRLRILQRS